MSLFDRIVKRFNKGEDKGRLEFDVGDMCPKCKIFYLLREFNFIFCSNPECDYMKPPKDNDPVSGFYDGVI